MCLLIGYGAGAVNPWVAFETLDDMIRQGLLPGIDHKTAVKNYIKALNKGILKVMAKMGISALQSYCGAQIFEAIGLDKESRGPLLHRHALPRQRDRARRRRRGGPPPARARVPGAPGRPRGARLGRRVPVAPRRRVPPLQSRDGAEAPARDAQRPVPDLQGVHARRRRPEPEPGHAARPLRAPPRRDAGPARRGGARRVDPPALRHRGHVVRLDQPGGARDPGHRHEPDRRQVEHRRGRRGLRAVPPRAERRLAAERDPPGRVGTLRRRPASTSSTATTSRSRWPRAPSPARAASSRGTRSTPGSPRCGTPRPAWA